MCTSEQRDEDQCTWVIGCNTWKHYSGKTSYYPSSSICSNWWPKKREKFAFTPYPRHIIFPVLKSQSENIQICSYGNFCFDLHVTEIMNLLPSDLCCFYLSACLIVCLEKKNPWSFCHCSLTVNQQWSRMAQSRSKVLKWMLTHVIRRVLGSERWTCWNSPKITTVCVCLLPSSY